MRAILAVLLAFLANDSIAKPKVEAPAVDRAAIHAAIKTVGMMPIRVPGYLPDADGLARRYEAEVQARIEAAGFEVVSPDVMREIHARLARSMGGLYDPMTGEPIEEKIEAHARFARTEYLAANKVDGFLKAAVVQRTARSVGTTASWDGIEERVTGQSAFKSVMTLAASTFGDGTVSALSFVLVLEDRDGKALYSGIGGLQLMAYIRMGRVPKHVDVDPEFLLKDPARDARAFAVVLDPLTGQNTGGKADIELAPAAMVADSESALRVNRERLFTEHRRMALVALDIGEIGQAEAVKARYSELLKARLTSGGFEVVGGEDFPAIWDELTRAAGGFYDPSSGRLDRARHDAARREALRQLHERHGVTAVVFPSVLQRVATLESGVAKWDGAEEIVSGNKSKLGAMFGAAGQVLGRLEAASLQLRIVDLQDATLYEDFGGIQALSRFEQGRFVDLPVTQLFSDAARDAKAVDLAMGELTQPKAQGQR
jgi:hypothetical protein